ncbi:MAG TPA: SRPBCC family protein [Gemmataceae bacterium]|nr:SRPBCC family protein [Gemmataceae bacterium]
MVEALAIIGGVIVVAIVVMLILAARKPNTFRIERSATIQAPPEKVFALINDFHEWLQWSPWEKLDPNLNRFHTGAPAGKGATYEWEGNKKVGKGRMEIKKSTPPKLVSIQLDFIKPFEAHNTAEFTLTAANGSTTVNWAMIGQMPFMFKVMTLFMSMDKMIGKDFEAGLANMKAVAEKT